MTNNAAPIWSRRIGFPPCILWRTLAGLGAAASLIVAAPAAAADVDAQVSAAVRAFWDGRALTAQAQLERLAGDPAAQAPANRAAVLSALLQMCVHSASDDCVARHAHAYLEAVEQSSPGAGVAQHERARDAVYYIEHAAFTAASGQAFLDLADKTNLDWGLPANVDLYLRQKLLAAQIYLWAERPADALRQVDKALSLVAALDNPEEHRLRLAWTLSEAIALLTQMGETERAFGLYKASAAYISAALPARSLDAAQFHLREAQLLERVGLVEPAAAALDKAVAILDAIEIAEPVRATLLAAALNYRIVACVAQGDDGCARAAAERHPAAAAYRSAGRTPSTGEEIGYLAARALAAHVRGESDPVALAALQAATEETLTQEARVYRTAGIALAAPAGPGQDAGLLRAGSQLAAEVQGRPAPGAGAWYRPGLIDRLIAALAISRVPEGALAQGENAQVAFALTQILGRRGASFDADALTALSAARDDAQRRLIQQTLRLRARRDREERGAIQAVLAKAAQRQPQGALSSYDGARRQVFRRFSDQLRSEHEVLTQAGLSVSGARLVSLDRFTGVLAQDEAALALAEIPGGRAAYVCIRRDGVSVTRRSIDLQAYRLDSRLMQAALTAGHAPSDTLDAQFPVASAVRLYGVLVEPFAGCMTPGGKLLWLEALSATPVPLAALLPRAPPKAGAGYDLAAADWLVKIQTISYAGSAGLVVAARAPRAVPRADLDFLGVGDPDTRGAAGGLAALAPLPETAEELRRSAQGFASPRILTGKAATEANLRRQLIGSYDYLSFATHGLIREDLQGLSDPALVLTAASGKDPGDDGLLTASEIADLTLRARFVALSACNTANYDLTQAASELPALASAFAVAGAPATLATLWPVDSLTTVEVAAETFAGLRADAGPADALARAQRAFLAAPPQRAYLHPRFWAPFVLLGDGQAQRPVPAATPVTSVETLARNKGEVLGLARIGDAVAAALITDADDAGRHGSAVRAGSARGQAWRQDSAAVGATRALVSLGPVVLAGGYEPEAPGRPVLQAFDARSGRLLKTWRGEAEAGATGVVVAGAPVGPGKAVIAVAGVRTQGEAPQRLQVMEVDAGLSPRLLFAVDLPAEVDAAKVTLTPWGDRLLLTYAAPYPRGAAELSQHEDDFDLRVCSPQPYTMAEVRSMTGGALLKTARWQATAVAAAVAHGGGVAVGGVHQPACGQERRAAVFRVADDLALAALYRDETPGESDLRALARSPDGRLLAGATKRSVVDHRADLVTAGWRHSGMLATLPAQGGPASIRMLDAGADVFISAIEASDPEHIQLGGAVGEEAVIVHLGGRSGR